MWGLSNYHRRGGAVVNREMRQATYNMFMDLGAVARTRESDLTAVTPAALSAYGATRALQAVTVAVSPGSVNEDGAPNLVFTFTRNATVGALAVNYSIGGTATNGTDYATIASPVNFADGAATATVTVNPTTDATSEDNETVILTVAAGTGYTVGSPSVATGTITNDDGGPSSDYQLVPDTETTPSAAVDANAYQLGQNFTVTGNAWVTAIKFYRPPTNTNANGLDARTWVVTLWQNEQPIGSGTVATAANQSGWITATLESPIAIVSGVTYTASYTVPALTGYPVIIGYQSSTGITPGGANPLASVANSGRFNIAPALAPTDVGTEGRFYMITPVVVTSAPVGVLNNMWRVSPTGVLGPSTSEGPYELGMRYTVTDAQSLTAIRFYRAFGEGSGTNTVRVWDAGGTQLASASAASGSTVCRAG
jgi:hypothetical protein